jgi:hypothetical protein
MYWSTDNILRTSIFPKAMGKTDDISRSFHLTTNISVLKVTICIRFVGSCSSGYFPEQDLFLDEAMVPWR